MKRSRALIAIGSIALTPLSALRASAAPSAIDAQRSQMTVHVYKQGLFSFLADDHEISAPIAAGSYDEAAKSVILTVDAAQMKVLDPKLSPARRAKVQATMSGPRVLDVTRFPTIAFRSTAVDAATGSERWTVKGDLTLRGRTYPLAVRVRRLDAIRFTGSATIRQSAFGIMPIRLAGGAVAVEDDVDVSFTILLSRA